MMTFSSEKATLFPFLLPLVFLTIPLLPAAIGMETFLALMLAMACITFYSLDRLPAAALACSLAVVGTAVTVRLNEH